MDTKELLTKILSSKWLVLIVLGLVIFLAGAAGALPVGGKQLLPISDSAWRIALAVIGIGLTGLGIALMFRPELGPLKDQYDVFLAAPMAAYPDDETYKKERAEILKIMVALQAHCGVKGVYYAGTTIDSQGVFQSHTVAAGLDLDILRQSKFFVMVYPEKIVSSVLFEAGFALALGKPSVYFARDTNDLPYLMKEARAGVTIYPYKTTEDIISRFKNDKEHILSSMSKAA